LLRGITTRRRKCRFSIILFRLRSCVLKQCMKYDEQFAAFADICAILTEYAIASRYPLDEDWINEHDMQAALKGANDILEFTKSRLAELGYK